MIPVDHRIKLKVSEKRDKYQDFAEELKRNKLWNMKVTVIPFIIDGLGTILKRFVKGLEDLGIRWQVETIQATALLGLARILRRVLETYCYSYYSEKPSANACMKSSQKSKIIIIIKRICIVDFAVLKDHRVKIKERRVLEPYKRTKKAVAHVGDGDTNCKWIAKRSGRIWNRWKSKVTGTLGRLLTRWPGYAQEEETLKRKLNFF